MVMEPTSKNFFFFFFLVKKGMTLKLNKKQSFRAQPVHIQTMAISLKERNNVHGGLENIVKSAPIEVPNLAIQSAHLLTSL